MKRRYRPGVIAYACPYCGGIIWEAWYCRPKGETEPQYTGLPSLAEVYRRVRACPHCRRRLDAPGLLEHARRAVEARVLPLARYRVTARDGAGSSG